MDHWEYHARGSIWRIIGMASCLCAMTGAMIAGDPSIFLIIMAFTLLTLASVLAFLAKDSQNPITRFFITDYAVGSRSEKTRINQKIRVIFEEIAYLTTMIAVVIFGLSWAFKIIH
jgi:hypothetical protein